MTDVRLNALYSYPRFADDLQVTHAVIFGDEPVPHIDKVLEQHPEDIILPEELPVKGIGAAFSGARSARFIDLMSRGN